VERGLACSQIILSEVIQPSLRAEFQLSEVMVRSYGINFFYFFLEKRFFFPVIHG
jgi:hypothetical protein